MSSLCHLSFQRYVLTRSSILSVDVAVPLNAMPSLGHLSSQRYILTRSSILSVDVAVL